MLLAIDTATGTVGAAVHDGERVLAEVVHEDARRHGELLAPAIRGALDQAGVPVSALSAVVCGVGPGPFTGLRVGVVTALTLAHSRGLLPPQGICSLDAVAHQGVSVHEGELLVATDARRREVYWARYEVGAHTARRLDGPGVARAADLPEPVRTLPVAGRGAALYPEALTGPPLPGVTDARPGALAELAVRLRRGDHPDASTALLPPEPLYLRRPDAVEPSR
ncbi:TsaB protein, required for threonylcarbamoyladenosine (t(6)A) formation in tRNA [Serinicoccus hydrothermalis]|uniref:TsaB protein, required for threonylcarbamoyladenosine (T(6)A) formation in tRNA n=1 Tax=Serinicoccus hydrothermalis TaxID=1758689 RepID=A0A1B1NG88_9MICO|nr:tRNA (adenosine(37)-N6)-threonylcarbamoyltransferase complex dimerization subunit type 1 TsaB [Serinicoccus hydrothermalis]ANS80445.1 TsaB protein, required for threonylcarbamoyladenosine (t(6)A) formation in tRNA [Serinicoccus hydrothermalis]